MTEITQRALDASARQDWQAAERLWRQCIEDFPAGAKFNCYSWHATALRRLARHDEEEAVCAVMRERWPDHPKGWIMAAQSAAVRKDWPTAEQLLRECFDRFPDSVAANWYGLLASALQQLGRAVEARDACRAAQLRFPDDPAGWIAEARIVTLWRHAATAWETAADKDEAAAAPKLLQQALRAYVRRGHFCDAARMVARLKRCEPDQSHWLLAGLDLLDAQGDARGAIAYLLEQDSHPAFRQCFPAARLAKAAFQAGMSPTEAVELLARWMPREDAARAIDEGYSRGSGNFQQVMDAVDQLKHSRPAITYRQKLAECRRQVKTFLRNRTYRHFWSLATDAFAIADGRQIRSLQSVAARLFPASRARLKIELFLNRGAGSSEDIAFASGWRNALPQAGNSIADQLKGIPKRRLLCATIVRNEAEMLPHFIAHHVRLGVRHFLVIDNGSTDGLGGIRGGVPGADIVAIDAPYSFTRNRCGITWMNEICDADICDWLLVADADEKLIFPGCENGRVDELVNHFDSRGETAMPAFMLDVYDENYRFGRVPSDDIVKHNTFYATHIFHPHIRGPYIRVTGGIRFTEYFPLIHMKVPLMRSSAVRMTDNHFVTPCIPAQTTGVLLHYKIFRDRQLLGQTPETVAAHFRVRDRPAIEIRRHIEFSGRDSNLRPSGPFHLVYDGSRQLLESGYLSADETWHERLPGRWPRRRVNPIGISFVQEPEYETLLKSIVRDAQAGRRHSVRALLNDNLPRIGSAVVRLGVLLLAAAALEREKSPTRIANALIRKIGAGISAEECDHLGPVLSMPQLVYNTSVRLGILDAIAAAGMLNAQLAFAHAQSLAFLGRGDAARAVLAKAKVNLSDMSAGHRLMLLRGLRDWAAFYECLSQILRNREFRSARELLNPIHSCPDAAARKRFLEQLRRLLEPGLRELSPLDASALLAVLLALKRRAALRKIHRQVQDRLPRNSRLFFGRLLGNDPSWPPGGTNAVWCLGMSKTGTTSLHRYAEKLGLFAAHFHNTVTEELLCGEDAAQFDMASDNSLLFDAMRHGVHPDRRIVVTTREFEPWQRSTLVHFARELREPDQNFERMRDTFYSGQELPFGRLWFEIQDELYFRHESLLRAYEYHCDWIATLEKKMSVPMLYLPLERGDKAARLSSYLGEHLPILDYPYVNPVADPNAWEPDLPES